MRPWRMSSLRVHISRTGRPIAFEPGPPRWPGPRTAGARMTPAPDHVEGHPAGGRPIAAATCWLGDDRALRGAPELGPARPGRRPRSSTPRAARAGEREVERALDRRAAEARGKGRVDAGAVEDSASETPRSGRGSRFHVMRRAPGPLRLVEGLGGDGDAGRDAGDREHPGEADAPRVSSTEATVPLMVGGRATTVGFTPRRGRRGL